METNFSFPGQISMYRGKVRDVYFIENDIIIIISTDRLSAFDVSIRVIWAWAWGERKTIAMSWPGANVSAPYIWQNDWGLLYQDLELPLYLYCTFIPLPEPVTSLKYLRYFIGIFFAIECSSILGSVRYLSNKGFTTLLNTFFLLLKFVMIISV